jgi:PIN domain nuclease of toxin-antitoxin system
VRAYVTDTHPLLWYSTETYRKLSPRVRRLFDRANRGEVLIWLPAMAIWEAGLLEKIGRIRFERSFSYWLDGLLAQPGFAFAPLDRDLITSGLDIVPNSDLFNAGIVATARHKQAPLITKDGVITNSKAVEVFW